MDADVSKNQTQQWLCVSTMAVKRPQEATDTLAIELVIIIIMLISTVTDSYCQGIASFSLNNFLNI